MFSYCEQLSYWFCLCCSQGSSLGIVLVDLRIIVSVIKLSCVGCVMWIYGLSLHECCVASGTWVVLASKVLSVFMLLVVILIII